MNYFNRLGLESRATLIPKGIYYVEEVKYTVKVNPKNEEDYFLVVGALVKAIDKNGVKTFHMSWQDEDYKHLEITECKPINYLRIEYEHQGRDE